MSVILVSGKYSLINSFIFGILVDPPTNTTSLISLIPIFALFITSSIGLLNFAKISLHSSSNFALVTLTDKDSSWYKL